MTAPRRRETDEIIRAYQETASVWKAARKLGISGQSVHERLARIGYPLSGSRWTEEEYAELRRLVLERITLSEVARRLGRTYSAVAIKVSRLDLPTAYPTRTMKVKRGQGYDKASTKKRMKQLDAYDGGFTAFCRANGYAVEMTAQAMERHFPYEWEQYVASRSDLPQRDCEYCNRTFVPSTGKQRFCSRKCGADKRSDDSYFGGRRRETIGLAERTCQLCERVGVKGLSSHHIFGKQNDPDNNALIALCPGCHQLVGILGNASWVGNEGTWERLISLAWARKHGPEIMQKDNTITIEVAVDIDSYDEEEWEHPHG
jgi:5-methylcytosine-specific restriction endonuclease McrA